VIRLEIPNAKKQIPKKSQRPRGRRGHPFTVRTGLFFNAKPAKNAEEKSKVTADLRFIPFGSDTPELAPAWM
jgi:hypothetical protein